MRIIALRNTALTVALFGVATFLVMVMSLPVHAQEEEPEAVKGDNVSESRLSSAAFSVTPVVANEKAKPRDILKKELLVTNNSNERVDLYISVENVDPNKGAQETVSPGVADLSTSLANWIEITRGVIELSAGESRKIPYLIHVNLTAKPGSYFARIQFREGARRDDALVSEDGSSLMLNLEVLDDAKERLQLGTFTSSDSVVLGNSVGFSYLLENVGNRLVEPRGSIRIFNRRGEEVGSVPLNADGTEITPENNKMLASVWSAAGRFGKYKAFLDLEYGENQVASVQDTVYFWVFPWKEILASLMGVLVLAVIGTYIIHMRTVARPIPSYARAQTGQEVEPVSHAPATGLQRVARTAPMPQPGGVPTVLTPRTPDRQKVAPVAAQIQASRTVSTQTQNGTVTLAPRGTQRSPTTHGNTVELAPRR